MALVLVAAAVLLQSRPRELDFAVAQVRRAPFDAAIEYLEDSPDLPDDPLREKLVERRAEVLAELDREVARGGEPLLDAAVTVTIAGQGLDRARAMLLLARVARLPRAALVRLEGAEAFTPWALAQLTRRSGSDCLIDDADRPGDLGSLWKIEPHPLAAVADELARRVAMSPDELSRCNEEYQEDYRARAMPALASFAKHVAWEQRHSVDLDGDGDPELVLASNFLGDDEGGWGWHDDLNFIALIDRARPDLPWRIVLFERLLNGEQVQDAIVRDFDRDGRAEVAVRTRLSWYSCGSLRIIGAGASSPLPTINTGKGSGRVVLLERSTEEPTRFVTSGYHVASPVGTWGEAIGVLAWRREVHVWNGRDFAREETLYTPLRW